MSNQFIPDDYQEDPNTKAFVDQLHPSPFLPEEELNSGPSASSIALGLYTQLSQTTPAGLQAALPEQQSFLSDLPFPSQVPSFTAAVPSSQTSNALAGPSRFPGALEPPTNLESSVGPIRPIQNKRGKVVLRRSWMWSKLFNQI
ncbi:hypothetical protein DFH28DRAFT_1107814 [Melampsora americana]|nr:hypothetical protein DFH28DRAFT_1107814 [Melampsora americana]